MRRKLSLTTNISAHTSGEPPVRRAHQWIGRRATRPVLRSVSRGNAMSSLDPWSRAAECDAAIARVTDPERRIVLEGLRRPWIEVCNSLALYDEPDQLDQLTTIDQIHVQLMAGCRAAMH